MEADAAPGARRDTVGNCFAIRNRRPQGHAGAFGWPLAAGAWLYPQGSESAWSVRRTTAQDRIAPTETSTPGYTLLNASIGYLIPTARVTYELFARGRNLTNEEVREHTSFLKEFAPQGVRSVLAGVRLTF